MNKTLIKVLDIRPVPPRDKHPIIFETIDALKEREIHQLLNDHDPMPLYYQFQAERAGRFNWEYLERGPEIWKVNITKTV